jgi:hypothetical protein
LELISSPVSGLIANSGYAAGVDALLSENLSMKLFSYGGRERKASSVCRLRP